MKKKSPVSVERISFYTYERYDDELMTYYIEKFPYDGRSDFEVNSDFAGLAVKLEFNNDSKEKGCRRKIKLTLIDYTDRYVVSTRSVKINISEPLMFQDEFVDFPLETTEFNGNHTYKLTLKDESTDEMLAERIFHLFDSEALGNSLRWYEVISGGVKPAWESNVYKVLKTVDDHDYYVRFNLTPVFRKGIPDILPELELKLYYPGGQLVTSEFKEPKFFSKENYEDNILTVDFPFFTCADWNGIFYAELLCMEWPIAGVLFDTECEAIIGTWIDSELKPLEEYSPEAAEERLKVLLPYS